MTTTTTTVTRQYTLEKYSRSRSGSTSTTAPIEWDHYSQPKLVVRLEATYDSTTLPAPATATAAPAATVVPTLPTKLLFQVTYDPLYRDRDRDRDHTPGANATASTITLDSIDFGRFSSREYRLATPSDQLPLKAVYRDSILGIRYLALPPPPSSSSGSSSAAHPHPQQHQQQQLAGEFRRVQLKFESKRDREQFVDAIRVLVPVKPAAEPATAAAAAPPASTSKNQKRAGSESASQTATPAAASASKKQRKKRNETQQQQQQQQQDVEPAQLGPNPYAYAGTLAPRPTTTTTTTTSSQYVATPPSQPLRAPRNPIAGAYEPPPMSSTMLGDPNPYLAATGSLIHPTTRHQQQQRQLPPLRLPQGLASLLPNIAHSSSRPSAAAAAALTASPSTPSALGQAQPGSDQQAAAAPAAPTFRTASLALAALAPEDLDRVLREALFEEGFDEFVHRVKETLLQR